MPESPPKTVCGRPVPRGIALLLAAMSMPAPFAIDTYLPSFPEIGQRLAASPLEVQQTLSIYLLFFALMTLWHGAIADCYGRRRVLLVSFALFCLASIGCALAESIVQLGCWRAMQGMTAGAGVVISRAIVRDLFDGPAAQRLMAHMSMTFALAPTIAPIIGGWLQVTLGWRSIFAFITLLTVGIALACAYWLPETLPPQQRQSLKPAYLLSSYRQVLTSRRFLWASAALAMNFCGFFVYILSAPVFLMRHLGLPETAFLWLFGPGMAGLVSGAWLAGRRAGHCTPVENLRLGYLLMGLGCLSNLALSLLIPPSVPWSVLPMLIYTTGMSLAMPTLTLYALDPFPTQRGLAASCQAFVQSTVNSVVAAVVAPLVWGATHHLALSMLVFLGLGAWAARSHHRSTLLPG